jgi:hypothetical protein
MNFQQRITVAIMDVLILVELCFSIYLANRDPENFTPLFFKTFLPMVIPTLILAKLFIRKLRSTQARELEPIK